MYHIDLWEDGSAMKWSGEFLWNQITAWDSLTVTWFRNDANLKNRVGVKLAGRWFTIEDSVNVQMCDSVNQAFVLDIHKQDVWNVVRNHHPK